MPLGVEVVLDPGDFVFNGDPARPEKKGTAPTQLLAHVYCGQTAGWSPHPIIGPCLLWSNGWMDQDATWYRGKPRHRQRCVRWGRSSPLKGTQPNQFSVHVYCGQTAGWMKTPLGTEVDLGPGHTV